MALNEIAFVVVITSLDAALSASVTCLMPRVNSLFVTSATVENSALARKPEDGKVTGVVAAKFAPVASGIARAKALFSTLSSVKTDASKSNRIFTPTSDVVTPFAKTSTTIFVPCPETTPDVTPSSIWLPVPPSVIRSSDKTVFALGPTAIFARLSGSTSAAIASFSFCILTLSAARRSRIFARLSGSSPAAIPSFSFCILASIAAMRSSHCAILRSAIFARLTDSEVLVSVASAAACRPIRTSNASTIISKLVDKICLPMGSPPKNVIDFRVVSSTRFL